MAASVSARKTRSGKRAQNEVPTEEKLPGKRERKRKRRAEEEDQDARETLSTDEAPPPSSKKRKYNGSSSSGKTSSTVEAKYPITSPFKPVKSHGWLCHIAGLTISSCLRHAIQNSEDPRSTSEDASDIDWSEYSSSAFSSADLQKIWWYISQQYPDESMEDILKGLSSLESVRLDKLKDDSIKKKYQHLAPKQPLSPYMIFYNRKSRKVHKKQPSLTQPEIARKMGGIWRQMTAEEKEKYQALARANRVVYNKELEAFYKMYPDAAPRTKKKTDTPASPSLINALAKTKNVKALKSHVPKQPVSPYIHFCMEMRPQFHKTYSHLSPNEITKKLGEKWSSMTAKEKEKYINLQKEQKKKYKEELKAFCAINSEIASLMKIGNAKAEKKKASSKVKSKSVVSEDESEEEEEEEDNDDKETKSDQNEEKEEEEVMLELEEEEEEEEEEAGNDSGDNSSSSETSE